MKSLIFKCSETLSDLGYSNSLRDVSNCYHDMNVNRDMCKGKSCIQFEAEINSSTTRFFREYYQRVDIRAVLLNCDNGMCLSNFFAAGR